jgi:glycerol kinase
VRHLLAVDAGTTGVTALVVGEDAAVAARGYAEFPQHFPRPGWVEHDPAEIWAALLTSCSRALEAAGAVELAGLGVTNQRETAVLWRREDLVAPRPAIVWQDRRAEAICARLRGSGHEERITRLTGLRLDPYFTGTSLSWLAENEPVTWEAVTGGEVAVGTVDSYLVARLTGGRAFVTDHSNASRTLLYDLDSGSWSPELTGLLGVPADCLAELVPSSAVLARTDPAHFLGLDLPIAGLAGDQQAALFGQACFGPGQAKCTYGTGSFVLVCTGAAPLRTGGGLLTTVAWQLGPGQRRTFAVEGAVFVTGAAVQWLRDGLGLIPTASAVEALAGSVPDSGGVVFVPALTGLGAPDWDPTARGGVLGITRGTTAAHLARATLEAIAFEVRDVVDLFAAAGLGVPGLSVDGGASANDLLCQLQADQLGVTVRRPVVQETTALGAAFLAGLGTGVWESLDDVREAWRLDAEFLPAPGARDDGRHARWRDAVRRCSGWAAGEVS